MFRITDQFDPTDQFDFDICCQDHDTKWHPTSFSRFALIR